MAGFLISAILEQLSSMTVEKLLSFSAQKAAEELKLVAEVDEEAKSLTRTHEAIGAAIEAAEKRQVKEPDVKLWLSNLKGASYDIQNVLDEWKTAILRQQIEKEETRPVQHVPLLKKLVCSFRSFSSSQVVLRRKLAIKIKNQKRRLDEIDHQKKRYMVNTESASHEQRIITTSIIDESEVFDREVEKGRIKDMFNTESASHEQRIITTSIIDEWEVFGREVEKGRIKDMLCCENSHETNTLRVISMVGRGGIGKTTLTRMAYNDPEVVSHFDKRIWVCVSDPFDEQRIAVEILESLVGEKPNLVGRDNILRKISTLVSGKKILLVLDDVGTEDPCNWEQLKGSLKTSSSGSRILVTTRKEMVGKVMGSREEDMFWLDKLSEDKCWLLFCHRAFFERTREECENLNEIGRKIVERCEGLPLAVKVVGGLLGSKKTKEQWQSILDSEMWEMEEVEKSIFPPLLLSYYDMSPVLRQCFSYCAIFPKDHDIEKHKLIRLWMAQGFIKELEIDGEEYFNKLVMHSFFQDFQIDKDGDIFACQMHDMVHDFAQFLTKNECLVIEIDSVKEPWKDPSFKTIRHLTLIVEKEATSPIPVDNNWGKLCTLLVDENSFPDSTSLKSLLNSIDQLTCLRALVLGNSLFEDTSRMLTDKIGKLIHLRYLDLSRNGSITKLPEGVCDLCNLQILDIAECSELTELPHGIGKLINLVHLYNTETALRFMPKAMERLTSLQTLREFVVRGGDTKSKSCGLEALRWLTHLRGCLRIRGLGNVEEVDEARKARLSAKTGLRGLDLSFDSDGTREIRIEDKASILEALQPPPTLEYLGIWDVKGPTLCPNWMTSLTMLKRVAFGNCVNWESLPPMGKLPSLEDLAIWNMDGVKKVGEELLGIEREEGQTSSSTSISNHNVAFPKLERLDFYSLENWEEWELYGNLSTSTQGEDSSSWITVMPRLRSLSIRKCPKLKALPCHLLRNTTIEVEIDDCKWKRDVKGAS